MKNEREIPQSPNDLQGIGSAGRAVPALALTGGLVFGGLMIAVMTMLGRLSAHALLLTSTGLYLIGVMIGLLHAVPLGLFGRDPGVSLRDAGRQQLRALLYTIAALGFGWPIAGWVSMTVVAQHSDHLAPLLLSIVGWVLSVAILAWSVREGWRILRQAYARWPERGVGTVLVGISFLSLLLLLAGDRPTLFGSRLRLTAMGGVLVACAATLWLIGPLVTYVLRALNRMPEIQPDFGFGHSRREVRSNLLTALLSGFLLTLLAAPFHLSTTHLPMVEGGAAGWARVGAILSRATIDEVVLRVLLSGLLAVLVVRWHLARSWAGVAVAVVAMSLLQTLIYLPGMTGMGLPSDGLLLGYALVAALLPGLVLGALYWSRGLGTALVANAVSLIAIAALTIV